MPGPCLTFESYCVLGCFDSDDLTASQLDDGACCKWQALICGLPRVVGESMRRRRRVGELTEMSDVAEHDGSGASLGEQVVARVLGCLEKEGLDARARSLAAFS